MTRRRWAVVILLLTGLLAAPAGAQAPGPPGGDGEPQRLLVQLGVAVEPEAGLPPAEVSEQRDEIADAQAEVEAALDEGAVVREFSSVPFTVVEASPDELAELQATGVVRQAVPDFQLETLLDDSTTMIGAPDVWPHGDGSGQTVAVLDTGTLLTHDFFEGKIVMQACFADDDALAGGAGTGDCPNGQAVQTEGVDAGRPCDDTNCNHGTHVAGIAVGDDPSDTYDGIAPGASLMSIRVFHRRPAPPADPTKDPPASAWLSDVAAGMQFAFDQRTAVDPDLSVINLSLGAGAFPGTCNGADGGLIHSLVQQLAEAGIPVVAASGNDGHLDQMSFPACVTGVVSVGSVTTPKFGQGPDLISGFSNATPLLDLLAPGHPIVSASFGPKAPEGVESMNGTSMAAPHVAGSIALLRDARAGDLPAPEERVPWLHGMLDATGVCITDPGNGITYRRIQVDAAYEYDGPPSPLFDDVQACVWYEEALNWLMDAGIANGFADNTFRPNQDINRAQVALWVWNLHGSPDTEYTSPFPDRPPWAGDAVDWINDPDGPAQPDPLMAGYKDGSFRPGASITRGEVTRLLYRAAGTPPVTGLPQPFSDVPPWLDAAVRWIAHDPDGGGPLEPVATGYADGTYRQKEPITRAQVTRMLQRFDAAVQP